MSMLRKASRKKAAENPMLWTDIPSHPGYAATERGFILNKLSGQIIANTVYSNGYVYVSLREGHGFKNRRLNRIIASTFHPNPDNLPHVNHEDGNKLNNHAGNLMWCTVSYNHKHAFRTGLRVGSKPMQGRINERSPVSRPVFQLTIDGQFVRRWPSIAEAARNGFVTANICKVCAGRRPHHRGYIWKYENQ